jgi:hypothetical protein
MGSRTRRLMPALGVAVALVAGCSAGGDTERSPGDPVTQADANALAGLLHRNFTRGGADFVATAPYGDDVVLTLTGEVDFRHETGRAVAVTTFGDGRADDTRTLFFTHEELWVGETPGLTDALAAAGAPGATYLHRPLTAGDEGTTPPLVDVLLEVLLNLSSRTADDPRSFVDAGYTWEGQRSIDSRLTSLFGLADGRTVAVAASDDLLTQFVTPLAGGKIEATVTLSDHGTRSLPSPAPEETAEADQHQEIAAAFGV